MKRSSFVELLLIYRFLSDVECLGVALLGSSMMNCLTITTRIFHDSPSLYIKAVITTSAAWGGCAQ